MVKLNRSAPYKLWRGRNVKDEAWNALVKPPLDFIADDWQACDVLLNDGTPRGCFLTQGGKERKSDWRCHFFVAGQQRVLGRGSVLQCAKLYDYALCFFEKYRVRKSASQFNFSKEDAESDMNFEPAIGLYLAGLEAYLLTLGTLSVPVKVVDAESRKAKQRARNYKRTIAGTLEAWTDRMQPHIFEIANQNDETAKRLTAVESALAEIKKALDEIRRVMQTRHDV